MNGFARFFERYFYGDVRRSRANLAGRFFLILFAADVCATMLQHGWRYGADGFNVAHFAWLDALVPVPTAGTYVALLIVAALAAVGVALGTFGRLGVIVAGSAFTASWAMSMLDSYQHHYLMSLVFACLVGMVSRTEQRESESESSFTRAWGYPLLCVTVATTYAYAAWAKMEPLWWEGTILRQMAGDSGFWALTLWETLGGTRGGFWQWAGPGVVATQLFLAAVYLAAPLVDRRDDWSRLLLWAGCLAALGFHVSVETVGFDIKWFSFYMIGFAVLSLGPRWPLEWGAWGLHWFEENVTGPARSWAGRGERPIWFGLPAALGTGILLGLVDLPGAGLVAVGAGLLAAGFVFVGMARTDAGEGVARSVVLLVGAGLVLVSTTASQARYDFYRYAGGDMNRRAPGAPTLEARISMLERAARYYERANAYAPPDEGREEKLGEIRSKLERLRSQQ